MKLEAIVGVAAIAAAVMLGCGGGGGGGAGLTGGTSGTNGSTGDTGGGGTIQRTFSYDFDQTTPPGWTQYVGTTPSGQKFVGPMDGGQYLLLTFTGLPQHSTIRVSFDLYVIGASGGNTGNDGISVKVNDVTRFDSNFSNTTSTQSYPNGGHNPAGTGKTASNTLGYAGYSGAQFQDSVYHVSFDVPDTNSTLDLRWDGHMDEPKTVESWGIDNLTIQVI